MFKSRNGLFKRLLCLFFVIYLIFSSLSYSFIDAEAHDAYFYGVTWDSDSCRYIGNIQFQSNSMIGDNHAEVAITCDLHKIYTEGKHFQIDYNAGEDDYTDLYKNNGFSQETNFDNDIELLFTFPGYHTKGFLTEKLDANGSDEILAERINNTVLVGLNNCIDFICEQAGQRRTDVKNIRTLASKLGNNIQTSYKSASGHNSGDFSWGNTTVHYSYGNSTLPASAKIKEDDIPNGFTPEDYVEITVNGKSACFIYQAWKGYNYPKSGSDSTNLQSEVPDKYKDNSARDSANGNWYSKVGHNSAYKIGWDALILQAHFNKDICGVEFSNLAEIMPSNALTSAIGLLLNAILTGIRSFLGLYGLDEVMLNTGSRGMNYSLGLFPNGWVGPIYLLFTICTMIVWGIMGFAVVKIFMKRSLATMNIGEKVSMMAELKNLAVCCFILAAFPLIFNMLARINYSLVDLFGASTQFSSLIKTFYTVSLGNIGSFFASFFGLALQIYFNFFYVLRAITLAILYGIAPFAIYTIVLGGKNAKVFGAWSKEILSNIFVQTLHAMMISFFTSVSAVSGLKTFESLVVLYSFIPLTKFVKQNVFQASDGIGGNAAGLASMATGAGAGIVSNLGKGESSGGSGGGGSYNGGAGGSRGGNSGGGGGFGAASTGIMADRLAQSRTMGQKYVGGSFSDDVQFNATGPVASKIGNFVDKEHTTKAGQTFANTANKLRDFNNKMHGYDGNDLQNIQSTGQDSKHFHDQAGGQMRSHSLDAFSATATGVGGVGRAGLKAAKGLAMAGMALGTASFDTATGSQMMRRAGGELGEAFHQGKASLATAVAMNAEDKKMKQEWKNRGIKEIRDNVNTYQKQMDFKYSKKTHNFEGEGAERLSEKERNFLLNQYRARDDSYTGMSDQEKAFHLATSSRLDMHFGVVSKDGSMNGDCVIEIGKRTMEANRGNVFDYGYNSAEYREAPKTAREQLAEQKAESELYDLNNTQFKNESFHKDNGIYIPGTSGPNPGNNPPSQTQVPMGSPTSNPLPSDSTAPKAIILGNGQQHPVKPQPQQKPQPQPRPNPNPQQNQNDEPVAPKPSAQPKNNPRPATEEDFTQPTPKPEKPQKETIMQQAKREEKEYDMNPYPTQEELAQIMTNINEPGMYGMAGPNEFAKGSNPRNKS